jgi:hypothetical protein
MPTSRPPSWWTTAAPSMSGRRSSPSRSGPVRVAQARGSARVRPSSVRGTGARWGLGPCGPGRLRAGIGCGRVRARSARGDRRRLGRDVPPRGCRGRAVGAECPKTREHGVGHRLRLRGPAVCRRCGAGTLCAAQTRGSGGAAARARARLDRFRTRGRGSITAALFLQRFAGDVPWAHLDIAGPGRADADEHEVVKGGTAFGTRGCSTGSRPRIRSTWRLERSVGQPAHLDDGEAEVVKACEQPP